MHEENHLEINLKLERTTCKKITLWPIKKKKTELKHN